MIRIKSYHSIDIDNSLFVFKRPTSLLSLSRLPFSKLLMYSSCFSHYCISHLSPLSLHCWMNLGEQQWFIPHPVHGQILACWRMFTWCACMVCFKTWYRRIYMIVGCPLPFCQHLGIRIIVVQCLGVSWFRWLARRRNAPDPYVLMTSWAQRQTINIGLKMFPLSVFPLSSLWREWNRFQFPEFPDSVTCDRS